MSASLLLLVACIGLDNAGRDGKPEQTGDDTGEPISAGSLSIDRSTVDFGDVALGDFADEVVNLSNTGGEPLALSLSVDGSPFSITTSSLDLDDTFALTVTFEPDEEGPAEGTLEVAVDGGDTLAVVLSGNGGDGGGDTDTDTHGGTAAGGNILVSPSSYDFGTVDLGDDETYTFTVSNEGDDDLLIQEIVTSAGVWTTGGSLSPPQVLSPGSTKLLDVTFSPAAATGYVGTVTVVSDDGDTPEFEINVVGEGQDLCDVCQGIVDVDTGGEPYAISDFISILGSTDSRTITVQNIGDLDLEVTNVYVNNDVISTCGEFRVTGWRSATTLAPWATTSFDIEWTADGSCVDVAQSAFDKNVLHVLSDDPTQPDWAIELSGFSAF